jgi:F-type H+-transporting ATPase subunit epsilon
MAKNSVRLQIITPSRKFFDEKVDMAIVRTSGGYMGLLHDHESVVTTLDMGVIRIKQNGKERRASLIGGFAEVLPDQITILTDEAEWPEEIDVERAKAAKKRAEERLGEKAQEYNMARTQAALKRALVRIEVSEHHTNAK